MSKQWKVPDFSRFMDFMKTQDHDCFWSLPVDGWHECVWCGRRESTETQAKAEASEPLNESRGRLSEGGKWTHISQSTTS